MCSKKHHFWIPVCMDPDSGFPSDPDLQEMFTIMHVCIQNSNFILYIIVFLYTGCPCVCPGDRSFIHVRLDSKCKHSQFTKLKAERGGY